MAEPYLGEIHLFAFNFAPKGYAICDGSILPIQQYTALYSLLGTTYGGNGQTTFALPDLRGRVPVHPNGSTIALGSSAGEEAHTLTQAEMPAHTHLPMGSSTTANVPSPVGAAWAGSPAKPYANSANVQMNPSALGTAGQSQAHSNMQPFLTLNFCIALQGIYPSRS